MVIVMMPLAVMMIIAVIRAGSPPMSAMGKQHAAGKYVSGVLVSHDCFEKDHDVTLWLLI